MTNYDPFPYVPPKLIVALAGAGALAMVGMAWLLSTSTLELLVLTALLVGICPVGALLIGWMGRPRPAGMWQRAGWFLIVLAWGSAWCLHLLFLAVTFRLRSDLCDPGPASWSLLPPLPYCSPDAPSRWWALLPVVLVAMPVAVLLTRRRRGPAHSRRTRGRNSTADASSSSDAAAAA